MVVGLRRVAHLPSAAAAAAAVAEWQSSGVESVLAQRSSGQGLPSLVQMALFVLLQHSGQLRVAVLLVEIHR